MTRTKTAPPSPMYLPCHHHTIENATQDIKIDCCDTHNAWLVSPYMLAAQHVLPYPSH